MPLGFFFNPCGKAMPQGNPIPLIVICRKMCKEETENKTAYPFKVTHSDITFAKPPEHRRRMDHIKSVGYFSEIA